MAATVLTSGVETSSQIKAALSAQLDADRILIRPIDLIAFASDASFYRLIPRAVVLAKDKEEVHKLFQFSQSYGIPMTFRAAGSSLSGQSISDGLLVEVARNWRNAAVEDGGKKIRLQPGVIGAPRQPVAGSVWGQDWTRPCVHRNVYHWRHSLQQFKRHVLRRGPERISHAALHDLHAAVGHGH